MKICKMAIHLLQIPLRIHFAQANQSAHRSHSIVVELETEGGIKGLGESCPRTYVTGESVDSVSKDLRDIQPQLWTSEFHEVWDMATFVCDLLPNRIGPSARCALELALLDAWSKTYQVPLADALGVEMRNEFRYTGVIPSSNINVLEPLLNSFQFPQLKLKMGKCLDQNISQIEAIQEMYGTQVAIQADINTAWSWEDALHQIPELIKRGIRIFEQPFLPESDACMGKLIKRFGYEAIFMADESATTPERIGKLIAHKQCTRINLKISKHGGIFRTLRIYKEARRAGIPCQLGAHFGETCLLTYAGMLLASYVPELTGHEGGLGTYLLETDLCDPSLRFDRNARICSRGEAKLGLISPFSWEPLKPYVESIQISENPNCLN